MLNKKSFRVLISIFVVLLALVFLILVPRNKKSERNFKRYLVELNKDDIDKISFRTPQMNFPTTFEKNSDNRGWTMLVNGNSYDADTGIIKNILKKTGLYSMSNIQTIMLSGKGLKKVECHRKRKIAGIQGELLQISEE